MDGISSPDASVKISYGDRLQFLQQVAIFQEVTNSDFLNALAEGLTEATFTSDHRIFTQGEEGHLLYILTDGRVKVHLGDLQLTVLESGAYFGEMALFGSHLRSASVTTLSESVCLILTQEQVHQAIEGNPAIALNLIRLLCQRVRKLNRLFGASEDLFFSLVRKQIL